MEEELFTPLDESPFEEVLVALLDDETTLDPRYLYRLSDLNSENLADLSRIWDEIQIVRRRALIEDLEDLAEVNNLLSFEGVFRLALKDPDSQVRFFSTRAIEIFDTDDLIPYFLNVLDTEDSLDVRAVTASVLGKYVYRGELDKIDFKTKTRIEDKLFEILQSDQPDELRRRALEAISFSSREEVRDQILAAYKSENDDWVASAVFAMGRSLDSDYGEMVCDQLSHTSPRIRLEAVRASGELTLENALPIILDLLDDLPEIREAAIWSLGQIGGEDAGPALHGLLEDEISEDEADLIQSALERLDFLEEGLDLSLFIVPQDDDDFEDDFDEDDDDFILDDYDYQQDGFDDDDLDDDDLDLNDFDLDDDYWME